MKKLLSAVILAFILAVSAQAQDSMYVYLKTMKPRSFLINDIDSITMRQQAFSFKTLLIHQKDSAYAFAEDKIDSMDFHPFTFEDKRGFVVFRVDDSQYYTDITAMSKVFDKYGFKMVNIFNMNTSFSSNLWKAMINYQNRGHEIGDHTPNHNTAYTDLANDKQVVQFMGLPGVDKIVGKRVYFRWTYPPFDQCVVPGKTISVVAGSSTIKGDFSKVKAPSDIIYTAEFGWVHLINKTDTSATAIDVRNYWSAEKLVFKESATEPMYKAYIYDVYLGEEATYALLLSSRILFDFYGFKRPKFWGFAGNYQAQVQAETMSLVGPKFGYLGSICPNKQHRMVALNYNQEDTLIRWSQTGSTFYVENQTALMSQRHIANMIAKHQVAIDNGHFWYKDATICPQYVGTKEEKLVQYLATLDSVLSFCHTNNIAVLSYERALQIIFDHPQDSTVNMIPPLYNDLTNQGFPDGYTLDKDTKLVKNEGVEVDRFYSLKRSNNGNLLLIAATGGINLGSNKFSFWAKGLDGATITVSATYYVRAGGFTESKKAVFKLKGASSEFVKYEANLDIPNSYDHSVDIRIDVSNNVNHEVSVSGMYFGKK